MLVNWVPTAGAQTYAVGAPIELRGFASGTIAHLRAAESGGTRLVDTEVAFSSAVADADVDGVNGPKLNEMSRLLQGAVGNKFSYAKGTGLEAGLAQTVPQPPDEDNQLILAGKAEQSAPPDNKDPAVEEIAVEGDPLAYASLVRGTALANSQDSGLIPEVCVLGDDISRGLGYASDVELLDAGGNDQAPNMDAAVVALDDSTPERSVSQSKSRTRLVPTGAPNNFGLMSQVSETIAPVTVLQTDTPGEGESPRALTIELLGEWILQATALGKPGGAKVTYGTGEAKSPQGIMENLTSIVRIIDGEGETPLGINFEDLLGEGGLTIPGDPIVNISIAEGARKLAKPGAFPDPESKPEVAANGTSAVGAVDVLRVRLLAPDETTALAELRVGHMEVSSQVPVGGVNCPIPVVKTADPRSINLGNSGNTSKITITVENAFDCDLTGVVLTDRIRQREGDPDFKLNSSEPKAKSPSMPTGNLTTADVVWELGNIPKHQKKSVSLILQSATKGGIIRDIAEATGKLENCAGQDAAGLAIAGLTLSGLSNPVDIAIPLAVTGPAGVATPAAGAGLSAASLGLAAFLRRRRR
jgi:hypothetical protein